VAGLSDEQAVDAHFGEAEHARTLFAELGIEAA
jgi:hypothetical protein